MFFIYKLFLNIIIIISPIIVGIRILKNKEDKKRFLEKFCLFSIKKKEGKLIWFHGASVGEILSIIPIIEKFEKNKNINTILLTSSTLSSSKIIKKFKFKKTVHQFYPIDHPYLVYKFLEYWKPRLAIFIDSEVWPCMYDKIKDKKIPLILLNARLTKKTFNRWNYFKKFSEKIFGNISIAYPQNIETKSYLRKLKVKQIKNIGNLKFSENDYEKNISLDTNLTNQLKKRKVWVASSTHADEEIFCAKVHIKLKKKIKNLITIIIPRHIHRSKKIIDDISALKLNTAKHSRKIKSLNDIDVYIVDTFGETKKFHKIANSVFLGGSIIERGGQNPLEAARFGAKILHGPNIDNFKDVYQYLKYINVSKKITNINELVSEISFKKKKRSTKTIKFIGRKILKETIIELNNILKNELKKT